jgi:hypothetical protein
MRVPFRKFTVVAVSVLLLAAACKQQDTGPARQSSDRGGAGSGDEVALAETLVALVYLAAKHARDRGDCDEPLYRKSGEAQTLEAIFCERLARQEAKRGLSQSNTAVRKVANPPNR